MFNEEEGMINQRNQLNAREALYGFVGWLTSRKEKTIMSSNDDAAPCAELLKQFAEVNNLPAVDDKMSENKLYKGRYCELHIGNTSSVLVLDKPSYGGACHEYAIVSGKDYDSDNAPTEVMSLTQIHFQKGAIKEHKINGCQIEDLLAICIHRLDYFQRGEFSCKDNEQALTSVRNALDRLNKRTEDREKRGVEGTDKK